MTSLLGVYISADTLLSVSIGALLSASVALIGLFTYIRGDYREFRYTMAHRIETMETQIKELQRRVDFLSEGQTRERPGKSD